MKRFIEIVLEKRNVRCAAQLLDEEAPNTCAAVWRSLPLAGETFHAKYANNEIFTLLPSLGSERPGPENRTITPIPGDVMYFHLPSWTRLPEAAKSLGAEANGIVDLAVFYDRNNLLLSPSEGFTPGNVFAKIVKNLADVTCAGHNIWREGAAGERMVFSRLEGKKLEEWKIENAV